MAWHWKPSYGVCDRCGAGTSMQVAQDQHGRYHYRCRHCGDQYMSSAR